MAVSVTQVQQIIDSIAKACSDFNANVAGASTTAATGISTVNSNLGGTGASNTLGRVVALDDLSGEQALLTPMNQAALNVANYTANITDMAGFYKQLYPVLNALDTLVGGLAAYLAGAGAASPLNGQVTAWFAAAFNAFCNDAISVGLRSSGHLPIKLTPDLYFPYAIVDPMYTFTVSTTSTITSPTPGSATSTQGGGTGTIYLYKSSAQPVTPSVVSLTIAYTDLAGAAATHAISTSGLAGSSSLASGSATIGVTAQAITGVTVASSSTSPSAAETYSIGSKLVRAVAY